MNAVNLLQQRFPEHEVHRIMAEDMCPGCGSMLLSTPDGKVCLTCQAAKSGTEQGEPAWDELRKQATCGPPVETAVEPLELATAVPEPEPVPVPVLRKELAEAGQQKQEIPPQQASRSFHEVEGGESEPNVIPSASSAPPVAKPTTELARARARVGQLAVELAGLMPQVRAQLHSNPGITLADELAAIADRLEEVAGELWQEE